MMKIYADTDVCAWHLHQLDLEISNEIVPDSPAVFHMPFPYDKQFEDKVQYAFNVCTNVIIIVSELHQESVKFIIDNQHPKIKYFICGDFFLFNPQLFELFWRDQEQFCNVSLGKF